jgi:hypothetical protein
LKLALFSGWKAHEKTFVWQRSHDLKEPNSVTQHPPNPKTMRSSKIVGLFSCCSLFCAIEAGAQLTTPLGVEFLGRDQYVTGDPACQGLNPSDVAGVVPQSSWNSIDNYYNLNLNVESATFSADNGTTVPLLDTNNSPTAVTLSFSASDSWDNNVNFTNISTPNAKLMQGTIKQANGSQVPITFTFNNVPPGNYDVYVYCDLDGSGMIASLWDLYNTTTNYIQEQQQFYDTNVFIQSTATSVAQATNVANYVKFNMNTDARGQIGILGQYAQSTLGMGVAAIQLVPKGAAQANTTPLSLLLQPISRRGADGTNDVTFTVSLKGPISYAQWLQNGAPIPGQTNISYTPNPISAATMQNAKISFTASNNINSVTTSNATLTVGQLITVNGVQLLNGGLVNITQQPANVTTVAVRGGPAKFSVAATSGYIGDASGASPPLFYQWQSAPKGSGTFTDILNATNKTYRTGVLQLADDGTQFRAAVTASDAVVNSLAALLTVLPNTNPPVATAGAITKNTGTNTVVEVGVSFDEQVDPSTIVQGNFALSSGTVTGFKVTTNSYLTYASAILDTTGLTPGSNYTITAHGVKDLSGNVLPSTNLTFTVPAAIQWAEIGVPPAPGQVIPVGQDGFDILNGGRQEWNSYDEVDMAYVKKTNDFDVKVQVIYVEPASEWTRCGLVARNWLDIGYPSDAGGQSINSTNHLNSAYGQTHVNGTQDLQDTGLWPDPTQIANGASNNSHEQNTRLAAGAATTSWGSIVADPNVPLAPTFPDAWIRLARQGANLHGYRSEDGVNWVDQGTETLTDQTNVMYVGVSLGVETGNIWNTATYNVFTATTFDPTFDRLFVAQFRNFGDYVASAGAPTVSISESGSTLTINFTGSKLQQSPTVGAGAIWTAVTGAISPYTVPKSSAVMFFRAVQ